MEIVYGDNAEDAIAVRTTAGQLTDVPADSTLVRTLGDGDLSSVEVYHAVTFGDPESIEPIRARGVGPVNGIKWAILGVLAGLGLF